MVLATRRIASTLVDFFFITIGSWLAIFLLNTIAVYVPFLVSPEPSSLEFLILFPVPLIIYEGVLSSSKFGGTLGMRIFRLRFSHEGTSKVSIARGLFRALIFWEIYSLTTNRGTQLMRAQLYSSHSFSIFWQAISLLLAVPVFSLFCIFFSKGHHSFEDFLAGIAVVGKKAAGHPTPKRRHLVNSGFATLLLLIVLGALSQPYYFAVARFLGTTTWAGIPKSMARLNSGIARAPNPAGWPGAVGAGFFQNEQHWLEHISPVLTLEPRERYLSYQLVVADPDRFITAGFVPMLKKWVKRNHDVIANEKCVQLIVCSIAGRGGMYYQHQMPYWISVDPKDTKGQFTVSIAAKDFLGNINPFTPLNCFSFAERGWGIFIRIIGLVNPIKSYEIPDLGPLRQE